MRKKWKKQHWLRLHKGVFNRKSLKALTILIKIANYGIIKWDFLIKIGRFAAHNPIDKSYNLWYNKRGNINIREEEIGAGRH